MGDEIEGRKRRVNMRKRVNQSVISEREKKRLILKERKKTENRERQ